MTQVVLAEDNSFYCSRFLRINEIILEIGKNLLSLNSIEKKIFLIRIEILTLS